MGMLTCITCQPQTTHGQSSVACIANPNPTQRGASKVKLPGNYRYVFRYMVSLMSNLPHRTTSITALVKPACHPDHVKCQKSERPSPTPRNGYVRALDSSTPQALTSLSEAFLPVTHQRQSFHYSSRVKATQSIAWHASPLKNRYWSEV
jgi:hypothetical protein